MTLTEHQHHLILRHQLQLLHPIQVFVTTGVPHATLYMASRDNEAIPIAVPFAKPKKDAPFTMLPAAIDETWVPFANPLQFHLFPTQPCK
jgi:hypothetical protein